MKKLLGMLAFLLAFMVACDDNDDNDDERPANEVWMTDTSFLPTNLNVSAGTEVTWVNTSAIAHTVTSNTGLFDELLGVNESYSYTFSEAGTYSYVCTLHPGMAGTITVVE
jgi:plastocyanin